jgi:hypothetical protein
MNEQTNVRQRRLAMKTHVDRARQHELALKMIAAVLERERVFAVGLHAALDRVRAITAAALDDTTPSRPR